MKTISIVGCGVVGRALGRALVRSGKCRIVGVHDRSRERAEAVAGEFGADAYFGPLTAFIRASEIVIAAVPKRAIESVAHEAAAFEGGMGSSQVWLHCDGGTPSTALGALGARAAGVGVMHPAHAFPPEGDVDLADGALFSLSGDLVAVAAAEEMVCWMGGVAVRILDEARPTYHAAAVLASNCAVALLSEARRAFESAHIRREDAEKLAVSLASSAVAAAASLGVDRALSGPIRRGDVDTVVAHLSSLSGVPNARAVYRLLGLSALALAERNADYPAIAATSIAQALGDSDE